jgi:excisionase family DNA binding protein
VTEPAVYTVEEAARLLRVGRTAAYEAARRGDIPVIRVGRSLRVPRHQLERILGVQNHDDPGAGAGAACQHVPAREGRPGDPT